MAQHHVRAILKTASLARVTAVVDPLPAAQQAIRGLIPELTVYPDLPALLAAGRPDVIHIVTPPKTHASLATAALEAGCHVYVEKPFTEDVSEAERVLTLAARRGLKVCAGHQLLYEAPALLARKYLPALGRLVNIESYFSFRTIRRTADGRTPLRADLQLLDILPHPAYLLLDALEAVPGTGVDLATIQIGPPGTVHALVRRAELTATLTVTLEGRPVESYLRLTGTNGTLYADFVRGTVQRQIGPGTSGIDKLLSPYRLATQLVGGTTKAMAKRFLGRQRSYPGLAELFEAFYQAIDRDAPSPIKPESILDTVRLCQQVAEELERYQKRFPPKTSKFLAGGRVVLTGGTGFLGKAITKALVEAGSPVTVIARRDPPAWEQVVGADYVIADLAGGIDPTLFREARAVVHAAAETAGAWEQHQRNSIDATEHVLRASSRAGVTQVIHVSSLAVLEKPSGAAIRDDSALLVDSRGSGPYVWGKLESERLARKLGPDLGLNVKVVRPGAIVDYNELDPPGRLGKRVGNLFIAVGSPHDRLGVVDLDFCAQAIAWMANQFEEAPTEVNLIGPTLPTKRELIQHLRKRNPDLIVIWLPRLLLLPLSWTALGAQKLLRPGKPAINVAKVFAVQMVDTSGSGQLAARTSKAAYSPTL